MIEAGSFRDPEARVFYDTGRVLRGLSATAAEADAAARDAGVVDQLVESGVLVKNWRVPDVPAPAGVPDAAIVESERIPVISYPAEWSFAMLQDAALATLDANLMSLESGFILKDASAFNVTFEGMRPVILDASSLEPFGEKGVWNAYGQFCDHFLAPLFLEAYAGVPLHRVLRTATEGLPITDLDRMLRGRSRRRKGVLTHVRLRARLERRAAGMDTASRRQVGETALPREAVIGTVRRMRKLVAGLASAADSTWAQYESALPYEDAGTRDKAAFVDAAATRARQTNLAIDVGANAGLFTKVLARRFDRVVAVDNDPGAIDALYRIPDEQSRSRVVPLVLDITNPTPGFGWRGTERKSFAERVQPDFATWLAVVHHLCLGQGIPLPEVVALIADLSPEAVVEFVDPADPMAHRITASRRAVTVPYTRELFEELAGARFCIVAAEQVADTRTLYHLVRTES
jgi:hypothetical protein